MYTSSQIQQVNSLTYADVVGLHVGLSRLQGEDSIAFLKRCYESVAHQKNHSYEGLQDELCLQLGLTPWAGISVVSADLGMTLTARIGLLTVKSGAGTVTEIPTVTMAPDTYWEWRKLSDVVADLNRVSGVTATLLAADGPALQIANQSNLFTVTGEAITETVQHLAHTNIVASSLALSSSVDSTLSGSTGLLNLSAPPPANLTAAYQYVAMPYQIVCSPIGVFGLVEPSLATVGVNADNVLAYQLREAVQAVMSADPCYWAD